MIRKYGIWVCVLSLCAASFALGRLTLFEEVRAESETTGDLYQFGDCSYALGQPQAEVLASFQQEFLVSMSEPDVDRPEISFYTVHRREGDHEHIGSLHFEHGVLTKVFRTHGDYDSAESGAMVSKLVSALAETAGRSSAPIGVRWDNGVFKGQKQGNTSLYFRSHNEVVNVVYFDSPGGAKTVSMFSSISLESSE